MKMDRGLKEVYDGIKKIITITEKIAEHTWDMAEIKGKVGAIEERLNSLDACQKGISVDIRVIKEKMEHDKGKNRAGVNGTEAAKSFAYCLQKQPLP